MTVSVILGLLGYTAEIDFNMAWTGEQSKWVSFLFKELGS